MEGASGWVGVRGIDHVSIAVRDLDRALELYRERLGLVARAVETLPERGVRLAKLDAGGGCIEVVQPLGDDTPLGRSIEARGEGLHHLAFAVEDLDRALGALRAAGVPLVDERPRDGAGGSRIAFLAPGALGGVLVELVEPSGGPPRGGEDQRGR